MTILLSDTMSTAIIPQFDDALNASGLGVPAILRGTVAGHRANGVTIGSGMSTAVRTATQNALQAAINYASANGKFFELEPGYYEIYGTTPLTIPATGLFHRGTRNSQLIQFNPNVPILVIGDATGNNMMTKTLNFKGISLTYQYGIATSGVTNAIGLVIGGSYDNIIEDISVGQPYLGNASAAPYIAIAIPFYNTNVTYFNNAMRDMEARMAQQSLMVVGAMGTGNVFDNIYLTNGFNGGGDQLSTRGALSGPALLIGNPNYGGTSDNIFSRVNIEAVSAPTVVDIREASNCTFVGLHLEGVVVSGNYGAAIAIEQGETCLIETQLAEVDIAPGTNGAFFSLSGNSDSVLIKGLTINYQFQTSSIPANTPLVFVFGPGDAPVLFRVEALKIMDLYGITANLVLDTINNDRLPEDTLLGSYVWNAYRPQTDGYMLPVATNYTHYGHHSNATLLVPATLAAATTITLHSKCKASGAGSSEPTLIGTVVHIRRTSGTYANTLAIVDQASNATLATNTSAPADYLYRFNGTNWVALT